MSVMTIVDDKSVTKAQVGIPLAEAPHGVDVAHEARRGRRRLYPMTAFYSAVCLGALAWSLPQAPARAGEPHAVPSVSSRSSARSAA